MVIVSALTVIFVIALQGANANAIHASGLHETRIGKSESDLRRDLFRNYDKLVRPVKTYNSSVPTWANLSPLYLHEMDERNGLIVMDTWLKVRWQDEYLKWDPSQYGGIEVLNLPCSEVWKPDLTLYTGTPAGSLLPQGQTQVLIYNTGIILWVPPFTISSRCPVQGHKGPKKVVMCNLRIGSWTYNGFLIDLQKEPEVDIENFQDTNPDWQLDSFTSSQESKYYPCCKEPYPLVHFNVTLKRRPSAFKTQLPDETFVKGI